MTLDDAFLSTFDPTRKTIGAQVFELQNRYAGQKTQTVRETTDAMAKDYLQSLWKVVEDHKTLTEPYYITEILKPDPYLDGVVRLWHTARRTRPLPEWGLALYKVNNSTGEVTYEWGLPHAQEALVMVQNPEGWDAKMMKDIMDFIDGKLD